MECTHTLYNGTLKAVIAGNFTFSDHELFRKVLEHISSSEVKQVVINLASTSFVDSAAMGMFLLARDEASKHGKTLSLEGAGGQVKKMFDLANFKNLFSLV